MEKHFIRYFIVVDKEGFGWDKNIGKTAYPLTFITMESASDYAELVWKKFPEIKLLIKKAILSF